MVAKVTTSNNATTTTITIANLTTITKEDIKTNLTTRRRIPVTTTSTIKDRTKAMNFLTGLLLNVKQLSTDTRCQMLQWLMQTQSHL